MQNQPPAATTSLTPAFRRRCRDDPSTSTAPRSRANPARPVAVLLYHRLRRGEGVVGNGRGRGCRPGPGLRLRPARESIVPAQQPARHLAAGSDEDLKVEGDRVVADVEQGERTPLLARQPPASEPPEPRQARAHGAQVREPLLMRPQLVE